MIKTINLKKTYNHKVILKDVNLEFDNASVILLVGHNGSGKSTLLKLIGSIIYPDNKNMIETVESSCYIPEKFNLPRSLSVKYYIKFLENLFLVRLDYFIDYLDIPLKKKVRELSKGNLQKLALLYVIASNKKLILLDEPCEGMDKDLKKKFISIISRLVKDNKTVIISTHDKGDYSRMSPRIINIEDGVANEVIKDI